MAFLFFDAMSDAEMDCFELQFMFLFERQYDAAMTSGFDSEPGGPLCRMTSGFGTGQWGALLSCSGSAFARNPRL